MIGIGWKCASVMRFPIRASSSMLTYVARSNARAEPDHLLLVPEGGVEPPSRAPKARVLPLDDPGLGLIVPRRGRPQTELS